MDLESIGSWFNPSKSLCYCGIFLFEQKIKEIDFRIKSSIDTILSK